MTEISPKTLKLIVRLLSPEVATERQRTALVDMALGLTKESERLRSKLDFAGPTSNFAVSLVRELLRYGEIDGEPALWRVLSEVRENVGVDKQTEFDALRPILFGEGPPSTEEDPDDVALPDYAPPDGTHVFISYSREDKEAVLQFIADIEARGVKVWVDQSGLTPGTADWEQALRDAIRGSRAFILAASPDSRRSAYVKDEIRIAQMYKRPIYPVWVAGEEWMDSIPMGLGGTQFVDLRDDAYTAGVVAIARSLADVMPLEDQPEGEQPTTETIERDTVERNPYMGLQAFTADDTRYFFGRDKLVEELVSTIDDTERFLPVVGASGSGKSSVVMAGLLPRLREEHTDWTFLKRMVPGTKPLEALAEAVSSGIPGSLPIVVHESLNRAATDLALHMLAGQIPGSRAVLFVDQFEELFTLSDPLERDRFIDLLTAAAVEPKGKVLVILTMRADFMDRPLVDSELARLFQAHAVLMKPMDVSDLRDVIVKPAALQGLTFDENLVGDLLFEVRGEAGALPLLEFALSQLYDARENNHLTRAAYEEIGGVRGAIAAQAEATYLNLSSERHRELAQALFLRLIEPGATEQDTTRRRADRTELTLADAADTAIMAEAARRFTDARLLVSDKDTLEVAHEALIREWERLGGWLHDAREDLRLQKSLAGDVAEWLRRGQSADRLYRGTVLADALAWAERNTASRDETAFLQASQQHEAERTRREAASRRNLRYALVGLAAVIVLASVGLALIFAQNNAGLQAEVDFINLEIARFSTLGAADIIVPLATQTPGIFEPTLTAIAVLNAHDPSLPENTMVDEFGVEMVRVPAGCFFMGSERGESDEQPTHQICFEEDFWIDKYEVTNEQYGGPSGSEYCLERSYEPDQPRNCVTGFEARDHCEARGARLPTEAEWEYAARGPDSLVYPWGNAWNEDFAVWPGNSGDQAASVGSRPEGASWVGALDMSGNLWEWTSSVYDQNNYPYPYATDDGRESTDNNAGRVVRGGSFFISQLNLRGANRGNHFPVGDDGFVGFRCARPPSQ